jgi:transposase
MFSVPKKLVAPKIRSNAETSRREFAQSKTRRKNDSNDAERLARYARLDPAALRPVTLRNAEQQNDLQRIRVRHALLRTRTGLVNLARGLAKEAALRLPATITRNFAQRSLALLSPELASVLLPVLTAIDDLTQKIEDQDELLEQLANRHYPETQYLRSVAGVGTLTALTYVLTLGSAQRFAHSRDVGCYLGLRPAQRQSGESDPQLGISKRGNGYLRQLLVQCAHHILGPFGKPSKLRDWGLRMAEGGGKNAKKRAVTAVARKLAVLLHRLWSNQTFYAPFFEQPTHRVLARKA